MRIQRINQSSDHSDKVTINRIGDNGESNAMPVNTSASVMPKKPYRQINRSFAAGNNKIIVSITPINV